MIIQNSRKKATSLHPHLLIFSVILLPMLGFSHFIIQMISDKIKWSENVASGIFTGVLMLIYLLDVLIYTSVVNKKVEKAITIKPILDLKSIKKNTTIISALEIFCCISLTGFIYATSAKNELIKNILCGSKFAAGIGAVVLKWLSEKKITDFANKEKLQEVANTFKQAKGGIEKAWSTIFNSLIPVAALVQIISLVLVVASVVTGSFSDASIWLLLSPLGIVCAFLIIDLYIHYFNIWRPINNINLEVDDTTRVKIIIKTKKIIFWGLISLLLVAGEIASIATLDEIPESLTYIYLAIGVAALIPLILQIDARFSFWKEFGDLTISPYEKADKNPKPTPAPEINPK